MQKANGVFCGKGFNHDLCSLAIQRRTTKNYYVEIQKIKGKKTTLPVHSVFELLYNVVPLFFTVFCIISEGFILLSRERRIFT